MADSGTIGNPTRHVLDAVAIANGTTQEAIVNVVGFSKALVRVKIDQTYTVVMKGNGDPASTDYCDLYDGTVQQTVANVAGSSAGHIYMVDVRGLGVLDVFVANVSANPGTVSVWVTLI